MKQCNIRTVLIPGRGEESFSEHSKILGALEKGDVDEAEKLMRRHMSNLRKVLKKNHELLM
jgi:DNA-binding GntR family transcriptional regulator